MSIRSPFWNPKERCLRLVWRLLAGALLASLLLTIVLLALGLVIVQLVPQAPLPLEDAGAGLGLAGEASQLFWRLDPWAASGGLLVGLGLFVVVVWVVVRLLDRRSLADLGLRPTRAFWADLLFGLALGATLMTLIFLAEWRLGWLTVVSILGQPGHGAGLAGALVAPLTLFLAVGIYEELIARGYVLQNLAEGLAFLGSPGATWLAWAVSSALFGWAHALNPGATLESTLYLMAAGLMLGLGYVLTGQLALSIGLHISWNCFQGVVYGFPVSGLYLPARIITIRQQGDPLWTGGAFGPEAGVLGLLAMLLGGLLIFLWARHHHGATGADPSISRPPQPRGPQ